MTSTNEILNEILKIENISCFKYYVVFLLIWLFSDFIEKNL